MIKVSIYLPFDHYYRNKKQLLLLMGPQVQCTWSGGVQYSALEVRRGGLGPCRGGGQCWKQGLSGAQQ